MASLMIEREVVEAAAKELDIDLFTVRDFKAAELAVDSSFDTVVLLVHLGFGDVFVASQALAEQPSIVLGPNPTETIISLQEGGVTTLEAFLLQTARYGVEGHLWLGPEATPLHAFFAWNKADFLCSPSTV